VATNILNLPSIERRVYHRKPHDIIAVMADVFAKWRDGLAKTSKNGVWASCLHFLGATEITQETWDDLETLLIQADVGIETTSEILDSLRRSVQKPGTDPRSEELSEALEPNSVPDLIPRDSSLGGETLGDHGGRCQRFRENHNVVPSWPNAFNRMGRRCCSVRQIHSVPRRLDQLQVWATD